MTALRQAGLEFVAMSLVGPSVCMVTEKSEGGDDIVLGHNRSRDIGGHKSRQHRDQNN
ncbi:MAG TPA: hypothetical protein VJ857_05510 [Methanocorpusculum sp.]|nr:hypothetical protein [Methanocorpusculum sp.]HJJ49928.1 hypothetical protein [Methanocorpusculum sp.]HKL98105.1 hypothetical protein [Methanocorpusculum sp.]